MGAGVGAGVGMNVGMDVGVGVGAPVGAGVGAPVVSTQVWSGVVQSPSEQWWVLTQLQRQPALVSTCSQMPEDVSHSIK